MDLRAEITNVRAAITGDRSALSIILQHYHPKLYLQALRLLGNGPNAKDAMQDTYLIAITHISSLRDPNLFYPWLKKILQNHCYALLKRKTVDTAYNYIPDDISIEACIERNMEIAARDGQIFAALNNLSAELRSCVLLRYFSNFPSYDEIALILGVPIGTVRSRLSAAREKLSITYSQYTDAPDKVLDEAKAWANYYYTIWDSFYDDPRNREEFFSGLSKHLNVRFTSGKSAVGIDLIEEEFNNDMIYGSRFSVDHIYTCGNISILDGVNTNSVEYPDRCAPSGVIVLFRGDNQIVHSCNIFDSARPE